MRDGQRTLEECLIEAGFWSKEDGAFSTDEHSLALVLDRMHQRLARGVMLIFFGPSHGQTKHEARLAWDSKQLTLATGQNLADALCNAALALPEFLKRHSESAK